MHGLVYLPPALSLDGLLPQLGSLCFIAAFLWEAVWGRAPAEVQPCFLGRAFLNSVAPAGKTWLVGGLMVACQSVNRLGSVRESELPGTTYFQAWTRLGQREC